MFVHYWKKDTTVSSGATFVEKIRLSDFNCQNEIFLFPPSDAKEDSRQSVLYLTTPCIDIRFVARGRSFDSSATSFTNSSYTPQRLQKLPEEFKVTKFDEPVFCYKIPVVDNFDGRVAYMETLYITTSSGQQILTLAKEKYQELELYATLAAVPYISIRNCHVAMTFDALRYVRWIYGDQSFSISLGYNCEWLEKTFCASLTSQFTLQDQLEQTVTKVYIRPRYEVFETFPPFEVVNVFHNEDFVRVGKIIGEKLKHSFQWTIGDVVEYPLQPCDTTNLLPIFYHPSFQLSLSICLNEVENMWITRLRHYLLLTQCLFEASTSNGTIRGQVLFHNLLQRNVQTFLLQNSTNGQAVRIDNVSLSFSCVFPLFKVIRTFYPLRQFPILRLPVQQTVLVLQPFLDELMSIIEDITVLENTLQLELKYKEGEIEKRNLHSPHDLAIPITISPLKLLHKVLVTCHNLPGYCQFQQIDWINTTNQMNQINEKSFLDTTTSPIMATTTSTPTIGHTIRPVNFTLHHLAESKIQSYERTSNAKLEIVPEDPSRVFAQRSLYRTGSGKVMSAIQRTSTASSQIPMQITRLAYAEPDDGVYYIRNQNSYIQATEDGKFLLNSKNHSSILPYRRQRFRVRRIIHALTPMYTIQDAYSEQFLAVTTGKLIYSHQETYWRFQNLDDGHVGILCGKYAITTTTSVLFNNDSVNEISVTETNDILVVEQMFVLESDTRIPILPNGHYTIQSKFEGRYVACANYMEHGSKFFTWPVTTPLLPSTSCFKIQNLGDDIVTISLGNNLSLRTNSNDDSIIQDVWNSEEKSFFWRAELQTDTTYKFRNIVTGQVMCSRNTGTILYGLNVDDMFIQNSQEIGEEEEWIVKMKITQTMSTTTTTTTTQSMMMNNTITNGMKAIQYSLTEQDTNCRVVQYRHRPTHYGYHGIELYGEETRFHVSEAKDAKFCFGEGMDDTQGISGTSAWMPYMEVSRDGVIVNTNLESRNILAEDFKATGSISFPIVSIHGESIMTETIDNSKISALDGQKIFINSIASDRIVSLNGSKLQDASIEDSKLISIHGNKLEEKSIGSNKLIEVDGSILVDNSISNTKISTIDGNKIIELSIDGTKLMDQTIAGSKIMQNTIGSNHISSLDGLKLHDSSVDGIKLKDGTLSSSKIISVNGSKIEQNSISSDRIISVDGTKLNLNSVDGTKMKDNTLSSSKIISLNGSKIELNSIVSDCIISLDGGKVNENSMNGTKVKDNSLSSSKLVSVNGSKIELNTIPSDRMVNLDGSKLIDLSIDGIKLKNDTIDGEKLKTLNGSKLANNSITNDKLIDNSIQDAKIVSMSASKLSGTFNNNVILNSGKYFQVTGTNYPFVKYNDSGRFVFGGNSACPSNNLGNVVVLNSEDSTKNMILALSQAGTGTSFFGFDSNTSDTTKTGTIIGTEKGSLSFQVGMDYGNQHILRSGTECLNISSTGIIKTKNNNILDQDGKMTVKNGLTVESGNVTLPNDSILDNAIKSLTATKLTTIFGDILCSGQFGLSLFTRTNIDNGTWTVVPRTTSVAGELGYDTAREIFLAPKAGAAPTIIFEFPATVPSNYSQRLIVTNRFTKDITIANNVSFNDAGTTSTVMKAGRSYTFSINSFGAWIALCRYPL